MQLGNTYSSLDLINIHSINKKFGRKPIDKLELMSAWRKYYYQFVLGIREYRLLNYIDYNRSRAMEELADFCDFQYYGSKHLENYFTGFLQLIWLPQKFNVDKRTSHYSSMIISGQMTRDEALEKLQEPPCSDEWKNNAIGMIKEKLDLSDEEFSKIMLDETHQHREYRYDWLLCFGAWLFGKFTKERLL